MGFLEYFVTILTFNLRILMLGQSDGYLRKVFLKESTPQRRIVICMECSYMNCYFEKYPFLKFLICLMYRIVLRKVVVLPFSMKIFLLSLWIFLLNAGQPIL